MMFTREQLQQAQGLTRLASEHVVASALDIPVSRLRAWRAAGTGPAYRTSVNGQTLYERNAVLSFIHQNLNQGEHS